MEAKTVSLVEDTGKKQQGNVERLQQCYEIHIKELEEELQEKD